MMKIILAVAVMVAVASARPQFPQQFQASPLYVPRVVQYDNTPTSDGGFIVKFLTDNGIISIDEYFPIYSPEGTVYGRRVTSQYLQKDGQYSSRAIHADTNGVRASGNDLPVETPLVASQ